MSEIILASGSKARRALFERDLGCNFTVFVSHVDEAAPSAIPAGALALLLAKRKADAALSAYPDACVCGFDTVVECENTVLGKPSDLRHAREMLAFLNGKIQTVWTGYALRVGTQGFSGVERADLILKMDKTQINHYVRQNPVLEFAGAYGMQDLDAHVTLLSGSPDTVIGAPMHKILPFIRAFCGNQL